MWILLIEDEPRLAATIRRGLEEEGYRVDVAANAPSGEQAALARAYDAFVLDRRLPGGDGLDIARRLRAEGRDQPILMLTALADVDDRVAGLDAGADDYLAKPFAFEELLARLRALLRRPPMAEHERIVRVGALTIDAERQRATLEGPTGETLLNLRPKEYALLVTLARSVGDALSRTVLADRVWGDAPYVSDNALDVTVSGLRQRLADAREASGGSAPSIETVRGVGYRLAEAVT